MRSGLLTDKRPLGYRRFRDNLYTLNSPHRLMKRPKPRKLKNHFNSNRKLRAHVLVGLSLVLMTISACRHDLGSVVTISQSTTTDEETATLPPVEGPKFPEVDVPETPKVAGAPAERATTVSDTEAEWRKMLEPYLKKTTVVPESSSPSIAIQKPVLTPLASGTVRVGILLPLSGPSANVGSAMLNAAQMALFDFADADFELLPHDTAGQSEEASFAATLAIGDGGKPDGWPPIVPLYARHRPHITGVRCTGYRFFQRQFGRRRGHLHAWLSAPKRRGAGRYLRHETGATQFCGFGP